MAEKDTNCACSIPEEFAKYVKMQKDSADKHKGDILEHDGYIVGFGIDKFFAVSVECDGLRIISMPFEDLQKYELERDWESMMPLVRLKNVAI